MTRQSPDYRNDAQKVYDLRERHPHLGLHQARRVVERDNLRVEIRRAETLEDLRQALLTGFPALEHGNDY